MHLDEFQQKVVEKAFEEFEVDLLSKHSRYLESLKRMFPENHNYYSRYISDEMIPDILILLVQISEQHDLNLNKIARETLGEENSEYRPE